ncbi:hypothetical protein [Companilactobacillus hulinensis]|uniref:hypothetical protein n=1 Tax=Companilactobacillus hulinensis TaxID=2486007 RepID=UPI000F79B2C7|nr:hypothetical protein [Companilactobacillus hulinensis]
MTNEFNSIYVTQKDNGIPIWYYDISNHELQIDIHIQSIGFTLGKHKFVMSAKNQFGNELLSLDPMTLNTDNQYPIFASTNNSSKYGAGEFSFYIELNEKDLINIGNRLTINIKMDNEVEGTFVLLLIGENNG